MKKTCIAALGTFVLGIAPASHAGVGAGDLEAGASISVSRTETSVTVNSCDTTTTTNTGNIGGTIGYFITDMVELKGALTGTRSGNKSDSCGTSSGGSTLTYGVFSPGADFVFLGRTGKVAPFVGAAYGLSFGDKVGVDTDFYDLHGGAKFFIAERATIELKLTRFEPVDTAGLGRWNLAAGINVYF